jgi:hypothetical protein
MPTSCRWGKDEDELGKKSASDIISMAKAYLREEAAEFAPMERRRRGSGYSMGRVRG